MASITFDLPQPLGPTTPTRLLGRSIVVGSTNDLNPDSFILLSRIVFAAYLQGRNNGMFPCYELRTVGMLDIADQ
jgi:hypothetical protein